MLRLCFGLVLVLFAGTEVASFDLSYECFPNNTIFVNMPFPMNWVFANNTNTICTTAIDGTRVIISGCDKDLPIDLVYTERMNTDSSLILGGKSYKAYVIKCLDIPLAGYTKSFYLTHEPTFTIRGNLTFTPNIDIDSQIRFISPTGPNRASLSVGNEYYWTIDIPAPYYGMPRDCYALPGAFPADSFDQRTQLIIDGCTQNVNLILSFSHNKTILLENDTIRRYYTEIYAFKYINSDHVSMYCVFEYCKSPESCPMNCNNTEESTRKRRDIIDLARIDEFAGSMVHNVPNTSAQELHTSGLVVEVEDKRSDTDAELIITLSGASNTGALWSLASLTTTILLVQLFIQ